MAAARVTGWVVVPSGGGGGAMPVSGGPRTLAGLRAVQRGGLVCAKFELPKFCHGNIGRNPSNAGGNPLGLSLVLTGKRFMGS